MNALRLYAGPRALARIREHGIRAADVRAVPAAAGGPKGLILGPLDRFIFGRWLAQTTQPVDLVGASIGAWRMATACLHESVAAFERLEHDYIHQEYAVEPGRSRPTARHISERFGAGLEAFYGGHIPEVLGHSRYRLHIVTSRGRHLLGREGRARTPLGYLGAFAANAVRRRSMGAWLERVVFSQPGTALPFATHDYRTRQITLSAANFKPALQASCSIPFVLEAVHDIEGAPPGAYWDGGITDYHLHLDWRRHIAAQGGGLVLYPHFQRAVVPGWLDKGLYWRHWPTPFLDDLLLLAPDPAWVATLPRGKLPDRTDFTHHGTHLAGRVADWGRAVAEAWRLADEFEAAIDAGPAVAARIEPL